MKRLLMSVAGASLLAMGGTAISAEDYSGHTMVLGVAEIISDPGSGEAGRVVWFQKDLGNAQLTHDFVPGDPRASWNGPSLDPSVITVAVKEGNLSGDVNLADQVFWLYQSANVWQEKSCSKLSLDQFEGDSGKPGLVENFFAGNGLDIDLVEADVTQVGFRGVSPIFPPGTSTLGVAYTLFWVDADGNFTDINGDGKIDAALREIYYNDQYYWADDGTEGQQSTDINGDEVVDRLDRIFDFPTVAIHEAGHGLSAAHFGNIGVKDGFLFAKPRAVMNAIYGGTYRDLGGRDVGSHCSNWAQWPLN